MKSPDESRLTLGEYLTTAQKRAGFSLRQLETITGIPRSTIDRLLKDAVDEPQPDVLIRLANALELNATDLFIKADLPIPQELPSLAPYLRTKYHLPPEALAEAQASIHAILAKYEKDDE